MNKNKTTPRILPDSVDERFMRTAVNSMKTPLATEEEVEKLFCSPTECGHTVDMTDVRVYKSPFSMDISIAANGKLPLTAIPEHVQPECDDVCELFGGPPTWKEKMRFFWHVELPAWWRLNGIHVKRTEAQFHIGDFLHMQCITYDQTWLYIMGRKILVRNIMNLDKSKWPGKTSS